jgi:hypothetical protein
LLAKEIILYPAFIKSNYLKFNPDELLAAAYGARPSCATGEKLELLKSLKKMALVEAPGEPVLLNCYETDQNSLSKEWSDVVAAINGSAKLNLQSKVLIIHEILRTIGKEDENQYLSSGSIAAANFELDRFHSRQIRLFMENYKKTESGAFAIENANLCTIYLTWSEKCGNRDVTHNGRFVTANIIVPKLSGKSRVVSYCYPEFTGGFAFFNQSLLQIDDLWPHQTEIKESLKAFGCFSENSPDIDEVAGLK